MRYDDGMTRWLTDDELASWLPLAGVMLRLGPTLDSQLQRDSELTHFDYLCLAMLSEEAEWTTRTRVAARIARNIVTTRFPSPSPEPNIAP